LIIYIDDLVLVIGMHVIFEASLSTTNDQAIIIDQLSMF